MKALTFYSYKGGVGRTLALVNIAMRLAEFGKKVVVLDFDLEAPGVDFKFKNYFPNIPKAERGLVDFIFDFTESGNFKNPIKPYSIELPPFNKFQKSINLIPAGNIEQPSYWQKLARLNWHSFFYEEDGQGIEFILNMRHQIEKEFEPDFLLIDSRTGITDISGITLKLLADEAIILAVNNDENLLGSKMMIKNLLDPEKSLFDKMPNVNFVLTRLPNNGSPEEEAREYKIKTELQKEFAEYLAIESFSVNIIHSDRNLGFSENHALEEINSSLGQEYSSLFEKILLRHISGNEIQNFKNKKNANALFIQAMIQSKGLERIELIKQAIALNSEEYFYYLMLGDELLIFNKDEDALTAYKNSSELDHTDPTIHLRIGNCYYKENNYDNAIAEYDKSILIEPKFEAAYTNKAHSLDLLGKFYEAHKIYQYVFDHINPENTHVLNGLANISRKDGKIKDAYIYINRAIQLETNDKNLSTFYATLSEICAEDGNIDQFYYNLTVSLNKGLTAKVLSSSKEVYQKFQNEERLINLLAKYGIDINEIVE